MRNRRFSGEHGVSVVEAPLVLIVIAFLAMGVLGFVQLFTSYQHLTSASRSAARYAGKLDYDPTVPNPTFNRPDTPHVVTFAQKAAPEFDDSSNPPVNQMSIDVQVCTDPANDDGVHDGKCTSADNATGQPGQHVHVRTSAQVSDGPYTLISGLVDGLAGFFGGGDPLPKTVHLHSEAVAAYE